MHINEQGGAACLMVKVTSTEENVTVAADVRVHFYSRTPCWGQSGYYLAYRKQLLWCEMNAYRGGPFCSQELCV